MNALEPIKHDSTSVPSINRIHLWSSCLVAALGGLMFGYDWVVVSGADVFYEQYFHLVSPLDIGWAKGCALLGCIVGALISGSSSDKLGRKRLLMFSAVLFTVSSLGTGMANTLSTFIVWRIVGGAAIGIASSLSPIYIAEIAPADIRGKLVSLNQLNIVIGIVLAQVANWLVAQPVPYGASAQDILTSWNGQYGWRWMFCLVSVPAVLFLIGLFFVPESPRWLVRAGRPDQALRNLAMIGGDEYAAAALVEIEATLTHEENRVSFRELLEPGVRRVLGFGILLAFIVQWCGINAIFYYTRDVFEAAGFNVSTILLNIIIVGVTNLVFTFIALQTVDRLGRRPLTLAGWAGLSVIFALMGFCCFLKIKGLIVVALVMAGIGWYAATIAPMCWVTLAEIFPNRIRGTAMAISVCALWLGNFTLTYAFPFLLQKLGSSGTFSLFAAICAIGFVLMARQLHETKNKTLEEIEQELTN
ncbi:MAG: sugar porter family MFS transporter [Terracidiphilus sp.]|nr:sugar porter family MFS transporter [Terracidiphilus sp.]